MPTPSKDELLQLGRNFQEARILLTAADLDLFTLLSTAPLPADQIASKLGADLRGLAILLDALAAMGLLSKRDDAYRCEPELARYLSASSPESVLPMLRHSAVLWHRWSQLTDIVRGRSQAADSIHAPEDQRAFIGAMAVVAGPLAASIAAAVQPGAARRLLDVGGGPGTYTIAFLRASPQLGATLFDQPPVVEMARTWITKAGLMERVALVGGDFYVDELPPGHDLALLSAIIHQNSPAQNVELYRKIWRALLPGGRLIVRDHILKPDRTRPRAGATFAVNMLVATQGGNCYTFEEIRSDLTQAGFERVRLIQESDQMAGLIEAFRSE